MTLFCHTWPPLGLRFEISKKIFLAEEMGRKGPQLESEYEYQSSYASMNPLHMKVECRSDISKADLKIANPISFYVF